MSEAKPFCISKWEVWEAYKRVKEGPINKSLGTKEALAVRLRKLAIDGEKTLQGVAELAYQQSFQV